MRQVDFLDFFGLFAKQVTYYLQSTKRANFRKNFNWKVIKI